jgi:hypothetical protein
MTVSREAGKSMSGAANSNRNHHRDGFGRRHSKCWLDFESHTAYFATAALLR